MQEEFGLALRELCQLAIASSDEELQRTGRLVANLIEEQLWLDGHYGNAPSPPQY
jgi:hypothetical protein